MFNFYFKFRWNVKDVTQKCNGVEGGVMDGCTKCSDFYTAGCDPVLKSVLIYSVFNQDHNLFLTLTKLFGCRDHECLNHALVGTSGFLKKKKDVDSEHFADVFNISVTLVYKTLLMFE